MDELFDSYEDNDIVPSYNGLDEDVELSSLEVTNEELEDLQKRIIDIEPEPSTPKIEISFGGKVCPTRHGCTGTSYCDNSYGDYPY